MARTFKITSSYTVSYLHRKTGSYSRTRAPEKPQGSRHQTYGGTCLRTQMPHHSRIYILHGYTRQLSEHSRQSQHDGKTKLLSQRHPAPFAYHTYSMRHKQLIHTAGQASYIQTQKASRNRYKITKIQAAAQNNFPIHQSQS